MTDQSSIQTSNAGLIATFYGPRDELKGLGEWLAQGLRVKMGNYAAFDYSLDDLPLVAAQDTSVIQVTLSSEAHSAEEGWPSFCQRLSRILQEEDQSVGTVTTFTVDPVENGTKSQVLISTTAKASAGLKGVVERMMNPPIMRRIYREELEQLAEVAQKA